MASSEIVPADTLDESSPLMASSETARAGNLNEARSQPYPYPSHANAASFLSLKLSGKANYGMWKEQMICLLKSHDMHDFIDDLVKGPKDDDDGYSEWKRSDTLVKGWMFGSLSERVMGYVLGLDTAKEVWDKLSTRFNTMKKQVAFFHVKEDCTEYEPLCTAIFSGDWEKARDIINNNKDYLTVKITATGDTALHLAVAFHANIKLVNHLLREIGSESLLTLVNSQKHNPLHYATLSGNTKAAEMLVDKNPLLLFLMDKDKTLALHYAVVAKRETFFYMLKVCKEHIGKVSKLDPDIYCNPFDEKYGAWLLSLVIEEGLYNVAYDLIKEYPYMALGRFGRMVPLKSIVGKFGAYLSGTSYNFYQRLIYSYNMEENDNAYGTHDIENQYLSKAKVALGSRSCFHSVFRMISVKFGKVVLFKVVPQMKHLQEEKVEHHKAYRVLCCICMEIGRSSKIINGIRQQDYVEAITLAFENDIPEATKEIISLIPSADFILKKHKDYDLIQFAIINRSEKVYNLLVQERMVGTPQRHLTRIIRIDSEHNNMLHLAGRLAPMDKLNSVSGAALQMQRELQWFEEVKKLVLPKNTIEKNRNQETPIMVFRREHTDLRKEGEEWMKKTAESYTIIAALIITIVFAAAITVPGGNNGSTGKAILATRSGFVIFAVSDAISLIASTTSLLLFLSILTARFRDEDFLYRLPKRLVLGLMMLFLSVTSMMVAFSATLYLMFGQEKAWILIPIAALTCLPIASFVTLQLPLLFDLVSSTYGKGLFGKKSSYWNHHGKKSS